MPWIFRRKLRATRKFIVRKTLRRRIAQCKHYQLSTTVAVLGETRTGKTSVCRKLTHKLYPDGFERSTEYYNVDITLNSEKVSCKHELSVHDTPGNLRETFPHLYENVIRKSDTFLLIFSLASSSGLSFIERTLSDLRNVKGQQVPTLVIANKSDLESKNEEDIKQRFILYKHLATLNIPIVEMTSKQITECDRNWIPLLTDIEEKHDVFRERNENVIVLSSN